MHNEGRAVGESGNSEVGAAANSPEAREIWMVLVRADRIAARIQHQLRHAWGGVSSSVLRAGTDLLDDAHKMGLAPICLEALDTAVRRAKAVEAENDRAYAASARRREQCERRVRVAVSECAAQRARLLYEGEARGRKPRASPAVSEWDLHHAPDFRQPWYDGSSLPFEG